MQAVATWVSAVPRECPVCAGLHDEGIHEATMSIHSWFRDQITHRMTPQEFNDRATVESVAATIQV